MFSILMDLKTTKRNKLSLACINVTCIVKSALKARNETAINMTITQKYLSRMTFDMQLVKKRVAYRYIPIKLLVNRL